jgi:diamine N-acetyltransferase
MNNYQIVQVTLNDLAQLQVVGRQTFAEKFSEGNSSENLDKYLVEAFSTEKLRSELNDQESEFYFATLDEKVIGYLKVNFGKAQTELKDENAMEIERIYVLKDFHGKNAGQLLLEKAIEISRTKNAAYIWLGVWEENPRAINFYSKNGFIAFDKHIFTLGNEAQTDIMMKLNLS